MSLIFHENPQIHGLKFIKSWIRVSDTSWLSLRLILILILQRKYIQELRKISIHNPSATYKEITTIAKSNLNLDIDETGHSRPCEYSYKMGITGRRTNNAIYYARQSSKTTVDKIPVDVKYNKHLTAQGEEVSEKFVHNYDNCVICVEPRDFKLIKECLKFIISLNNHIDPFPNVFFLQRGKNFAGEL